jgi:hypothetical protein
MQQPPSRDAGRDAAPPTDAMPEPTDVMQQPEAGPRDAGTDTGTAVDAGTDAADGG